MAHMHRLHPQGFDFGVLAQKGGFSDLFVTGSPRQLDVFQPKSMVAIPTFLFALKTRSLGGTVIVGMALFWLAMTFF
jgi:branched-subunit amino acid transport protein